MRVKPSDIAEEELAQALAGRWDVDAQTLTHQPLGGGSHHWTAVDGTGTRHFVTVDELATKPWLGDSPDAAYSGLRRAFETAELLHESGLGFVVAPTRARNHDIISRLNRRYSVAVFPFMEGTSGSFGEPVSEAERTALCNMWAALHLATPAVRSVAPVRSFGIPGRQALERAIDDVARPWHGGPHSERTRDWLAENGRTLRRSLDLFDRLVTSARKLERQRVITHGEPHGGNLIRNGLERHLVDWDTVALALPECDLWMLDDGSAHAFDAYVEMTGWPVDREALGLYRLTWLLSDCAAFVSRLEQDHVDDADSRRAWEALNTTGTELEEFLLQAHIGHVDVGDRP